MKRFFLFIIVLLCLAGGALLFGPSLVPADVYRTQLANQVKNATGRDLVIKGDVKVNLLPRTQIQMDDVTFANMEGGSARHMAEMDALRVDIGILSLLSGTIDVQEFVLVRPEINLEVDRDGRANWEFETAQTAAGGPAPETSGGAGEPSEGGALPSNLSLGDVRLEEGRVSYVNRQDGSDYKLDSINAKLQLPDLQSPFQADGSAIFNDEQVKLTALVEQPKALLDGQSTPLTLDVASDRLAFDFNGTVTAAQAVALAGRTALDVPSVRNLMAWVGAKAPMENGLGPLKIEGDLKTGTDTITFAGASLLFDEITGTGDFTVNTSGSVPLINGTMDLASLDLRPYESAPAEPASSGGQGKRASNPEGWSNDPIDFSALKSVNADLALTVGSLFVQDFELGKTDLQVKLRNGVLTTNLQELNLYEGGGKGTFVLDASRRNAQVRANFSLDAVQASPILANLIGKEFLQGVGRVNFDLTTEGRSQRQFMNALNGEGGIALRDGKIVGIDIVSIIKALDDLGSQLTSGSLNFGDYLGANSSTDFLELGGTFGIEKGVITNVDSKLLNQLLSLSGAGTINLAKQTIDYRVDPGADTSDGGLDVGLLIEGDWSNLKYSPAIGDALTNEVQNQITEQLGIDEESAAGQLLKGLFGGGN